MRSVFVSLVSVALLAGSAAAQFTINTPSSPAECEPLLIVWSGGTPPYFLSILPGNDPTGAPLEDLGQQTGTSVTWVVDQPPGTSLGLTIRDSSGAIAQSAAFTVVASAVTSCIGKPASTTSAGTGATSPAGTGVTTATTPATTPTVPVTTSAPKPSTTASASGTTTHANGTGTTAAPAASTTTHSSASRAVQIGIAAILGGAAVVAFLG